MPKVNRSLKFKLEHLYRNYNLYFYIDYRRNQQQEILWEAPNANSTWDVKDYVASLQNLINIILIT